MPDVSGATVVPGPTGSGCGVEGESPPRKNLRMTLRKVGETAGAGVVIEVAGAPHLLTDAPLVVPGKNLHCRGEQQSLSAVQKAPSELHIPVVPEVPLVPDASLVPEVPDVPEVPEVPDVPLVPEVPEPPVVVPVVGGGPPHLPAVQTPSQQSDGLAVQLKPVRRHVQRPDPDAKLQNCVQHSPLSAQEVFSAWHESESLPPVPEAPVVAAPAVIAIIAAAESPVVEAPTPTPTAAAIVAAVDPAPATCAYGGALYGDDCMRTAAGTRATLRDATTNDRLCRARRPCKDIVFRGNIEN